MMSESEHPIESKEVVVKGRFEKLSDALKAFGSEARKVDQEIEAWTQRVRDEKRACAAVRSTPSPEMPVVEDAVLETKGETGGSEEKGEGAPGENGGVKMEEAPDEKEMTEEEAKAGSQWYYAWGCERKGPVSDRDLRRLLKTGRLLATTLVWTKGQGDWISAEKADLVRVEDEKPPLHPSASVMETESRKDCPGCGNANREGANFCSGCGRSLAGVGVVSRIRPEACPSCEVPVTPEARFCRCCGTRLRQGMLSNA